MGYEYRIVTTGLSLEAAQTLLSRALDGKGVETPYGWEFRAIDSEGLIPDVLIRPEGEGFYVLLNGITGLNAELLGYLAIRAAEFGSVSIRLWEE